MKTKTHFDEILQSMSDIHDKKNTDYGDSFHKSLDEFGLIAFVVRMSDKMNRIKTLTKQEAQIKSESIKDTLLDLANYCVLTIEWLDKNQSKQQKNEGSKHHLYIS